MSAPSTWPRSAPSSACLRRRTAGRRVPHRLRRPGLAVVLLDQPPGRSCRARHRLVRADVAAQAQYRSRSTTPGSSLLSTATTALILFTDFGGSDGWTSWSAAALLAVMRRRCRRPACGSSCEQSSRSSRCRSSATGPSSSPPLLGAAVGLGMFSALAFLPTFLQMSSGLVRGRVRPADAADGGRASSSPSRARRR